MHCLRLLPLLLAAALVACAGPTPPPLTSLDGRACSAQPNLLTAQPVILEKGTQVKAELDGNAACMELPGGGKGAYAAFRLPASAEPYLLGVASAALGQTLFSPRAMLLDADGKLLREVPRETFRFHGASLYAGIRARPEERFLVVFSDPTSVGKDVSQIQGSTQQTMVSTGVGFVQIHTGGETVRKVTFSHNGSLTVGAQPWPTIN